MDVKRQIVEVEAELAGAGISVARLCRAADVAPTNWSRWKDGRVARPDIWRRVTEALDQLVPGAATRISPLPQVERLPERASAA